MRFYFILIGGFFFVHCSPRAYFPERIYPEGAVIAVLPFTGQTVSRSFSHFAADEMNRLLFVEKKKTVIDRSQVNARLRSLEIENPYYLSPEQLKTLADTVHATIIVLGHIDIRIIRVDNDHTLTEMGVTLRFLDGKSAAIAGMISDQVVSEKHRKEILRELLRSMAGRM